MCAVAFARCSPTVLSRLSWTNVKQGPFCAKAWQLRPLVASVTVAHPLEVETDYVRPREDRCARYAAPGPPPGRRAHSCGVDPAAGCPRVAGAGRAPHALDSSAHAGQESATQHLASLQYCPTGWGTLRCGSAQLVGGACPLSGREAAHSPGLERTREPRAADCGGGGGTDALEWDRTLAEPGSVRAAGAGHRRDQRAREAFRHRGHHAVSHRQTVGGLCRPGCKRARLWTNLPDRTYHPTRAQGNAGSLSGICLDGSRAPPLLESAIRAALGAYREEESHCGDRPQTAGCRLACAFQAGG